MDKILGDTVILKVFEDKNITLLARIRSNLSVFSYLVAWYYNPSDSTCLQFYYFGDIENALEYIKNSK